VGGGASPSPPPRLAFSLACAGLPYTTAQASGAALLGAVGNAIADMIGAKREAVAVSLAPGQATQRRLQQATAAAGGANPASSSSLLSTTSTTFAGLVSGPADSLVGLLGMLATAMANASTAGALSARVAAAAGLPPGSVNTVLTGAGIAVPASAASAPPPDNSGSESSSSGAAAIATEAALGGALAIALLAGSAAFVRRGVLRRRKQLAALVKGPIVVGPHAKASSDSFNNPLLSAEAGAEPDGSSAGPQAQQAEQALALQERKRERKLERKRQGEALAQALAASEAALAVRDAQLAATKARLTAAERKRERERRELQAAGDGAASGRFVSLPMPTSGSSAEPDVAVGMMVRVPAAGRGASVDDRTTADGRKLRAGWRRFGPDEDGEVVRRTRSTGAVVASAHLLCFPSPPSFPLS